MRFSLAVCVLTMVAFLIIQASAQEIHADLCMHGCPSGSPTTNDIIIRDIYILSSNDSTKFADWVAYRVTKSTIGQTQKRIWRADPRLAGDDTLEPKDYDGASAALKTDRGHQAPLASFTATPSWEATNYLLISLRRRANLTKVHGKNWKTRCAHWPRNQILTLSM